ncbi:hypothetical protein ACFLXQ_05665 [Chloroflexota bacterium]
MSEFLQGLLLALIPSLIISILTAYVTVRLSIRQFYSERWWEKKAEAYSSIIEQLSYLQYCLELWFSESIGARILSKEDKEKVLEEYKRVEQALKKSAAAGAYIVSDDTAITLKEVIRVFDEPGARYDRGNWLKEMEKDYTVVKDCIVKVREYAKKDLHRK